MRGSLPRLLLHQERAGSAAHPRSAARDDLPGAGRLRPLPRRGYRAGCLQRPAPRTLAGQDHDGRLPGGLLTAFVLHRTRRHLLRDHSLADPALPAVRPTLGRPDRLSPDDDPALAGARRPVRGLLHATHAQSDARDAQRGLHPHRACQGPAGARRRTQARPARWSHAHRHGGWPGLRRPARRRDHPRDDLQPARVGQPRRIRCP